MMTRKMPPRMGSGMVDIPAASLPTKETATSTIPATTSTDLLAVCTRVRKSCTTNAEEEEEEEEDKEEEEEEEEEEENLDKKRKKRWRRRKTKMRNLTKKKKKKKNDPCSDKHQYADNLRTK